MQLVVGEAGKEHAMEILQVYSAEREKLRCKYE
jgi:hypothetical protein